MLIFHPEINRNLVRGEIINISNGRVEVMEIYSQCFHEHLFQTQSSSLIH